MTSVQEARCLHTLFNILKLINNIYEIVKNFGLNFCIHAELGLYSLFLNVIALITEIADIRYLGY